MEHIQNVKAVEKSQVAIKLNADGTSKIEYNIGDKVAFYLPPSDETVKAMGKNRKHILQYVGPGEIIVESLSPNNTSFRIKYKNRHYERNVMHVLRYKSPEEVPADLQMYVDNTVSVGRSPRRQRGPALPRGPSDRHHRREHYDSLLGNRGKTP